MGKLLILQEASTKELIVFEDVFENQKITVN